MVLRSYTGGLFSDNRQRFPASLSYTYAGDIEKNTYRARAFSRFAVEKNCIPMAPHLLFPQFMNESTERWLGLKMGIVLLGKCEQVWVFGDLISEGMAAEIEKAKKQRKTIRYFTEALKEVGHEDSLW